MVDMLSYPWATAWKSCWSLTVGEWDWEQLAFPMSHFSFTHLPLWPLCTAPLSSSSSLHLPPFSRARSFPSASFLHAALLNLFSLFQILPLFCSSFLLCAAFPHFRSLSANSRCLIHQHLLKLLAVLCTSVAWCMCETVCVFECACAGKLEKVCEIMCMHVTVSSSHLWHAASPHASVRKQHRWQNPRCHGGGNRSSETNSNTLQRDTSPESMRISGPSVSSQV